MRMPKPDASVLVRRKEIVEALRALVPGEGVIDDLDELKVYETDALTAYRQPPMIVVLPETTEQVSEVLAYCHGHGVKVVPRGAGTSLSGGALPLADGILLGLGKFNRILEIDYRQPLRDGAAGRRQPRHIQCRRRTRLLLRTRSVEPDRLFDRRQRRRERGRGALPEVRADHQQRARRRDGADHRRGRAARRQTPRQRGLRPAGRHHRLGGPAGRPHRGDGAHHPQAGDGARPADRLRRRRKQPADASPA